MPMVKIHLINNGQIIDCEADANLYEVLSTAGLMDAPCGGTGLCGKCKVRIDSPQPIATDDIENFFTPDEIACGWRLACLCQVESDMSVDLPQQFAMTNIISQGYMKEFVHAPAYLANTGGQSRPPKDNSSATAYGVAIDIGTTTVVATLVDMEQGREIESLACLNGQNVFGQDVMTRIHYAGSHSRGTEILQKTIIKDLSILINELCRRHNLSADHIYDVCVGANTTIVHLLAGIDPASMGQAPYLPAFQGALSLNGRDLGLPVASACSVYCLPAVSSYVGGDITGGLMACGLEEAKENTLFIDIGTNGEIVLADGEAFYACSCAAGPALEGMNISCGVRAAPGAIEDVVIVGDRIEYTTIDDEPANGICGSGLLAAIAEMRRAGIIHKSGRLQSHSRVETTAGKRRFVIDAERNIYLTQQDIRQVQLAKGAILSGIYALLNQTGMKPDELARVIVAGQFGAHLKADSLVGSGLLPSEWGRIITYAGNTSKSGALICLLYQPERSLIENLARNIRYIELSILEGYADLFVKYMQFAP